MFGLMPHAQDGGDTRCPWSRSATRRSPILVLDIKAVLPIRFRQVTLSPYHRLTLT
jgi:hypothetical protein